MGSSLGTGGMATKLVAAELATAAGVTTFISNGSKPKNILNIIESINNGNLSDAPLHTRFIAKNNPLLDRKWWIQYGLHTAGIVYVDEGAANAILLPKLKSSLFAAGIVDVEGSFVAHQAVDIILRRTKQDGQIEDILIGKGLVMLTQIV
ncbi:hypothetical protein G6F68_017452 [Rhizopus microsporus]|nr:hypothetical protein G6F68_017452 [Rhizopus microsporus]